MLDALRAEFASQKRSGLLSFAIVGGAIPAIANAMMPIAFEWNHFAMASTLYLNLSSLLIIPSLSGYALTREYDNRTMGLSRSAPIPRAAILGAKLLSILPLIALMYALSFGATLLSGIIRCGGLPPSDPLLWKRWLSSLTGLAAIHYALAPAALLAAVLGRKAISPILVGLAYIVLYKLATYSSLGSLVPPCMPTFYFFSAWDFTPPDIVARFKPLASLVILGLWAAGFFCCALLAFSRQEEGER
jgi:ABC-type transport system involved in multi-copper enzyme maturation permease subunit